MESSEAGGDTLCRVNGTLVHELSHGPTYLQSMVLELKLRAPTRNDGLTERYSPDDPMFILINWE